MRINELNIFFYSLIAIALLSPAPYCSIPLGNTFVYWIFAFCIILLIPYVRKMYDSVIQSEDYFFVKCFLIWTFIGVVRGIFIADNYWEYKNMINGTLCCLIPALTYTFCPGVLLNFYRTWVKICIPAFFLFYLWTVTPGEVNFYLGPVFVIGCFLPYMPKKWKYIIGFLLVFMLVSDLGARSQVIKALLAICFSMLCLFRQSITDKMLRIAHWTCYVSAVLLVVLGISGTFNIFTDMASNSGKYVEKKVVNGELKEEDLSTDTRTFIYEEVLQSALRNDYVLCGRSLARGNDSNTFGIHMAEELKTGKF